MAWFRRPFSFWRRACVLFTASACCCRQQPPQFSEDGFTGDMAWFRRLLSFRRRLVSPSQPRHGAAGSMHLICEQAPAADEKCQKQSLPHNALRLQCRLEHEQHSVVVYCEPAVTRAVSKHTDCPSFGAVTLQIDQAPCWTPKSCQISSFKSLIGLPNQRGSLMLHSSQQGMLQQRACL